MKTRRQGKTPRLARRLWKRTGRPRRRAKEQSQKLTRTISPSKMACNDECERWRKTIEEPAIALPNPNRLPNGLPKDLPKDLEDANSFWLSVTIRSLTERRVADDSDREQKDISWRRRLHRQTVIAWKSV